MVNSITHIGSDGGWPSATTNGRDTLTFTFSNEVLISGLALWNNTSTSAVRRFQLFADDDNDFTDDMGTLLDTFEALQGSQPNISPQTFFFEATRTQYIHLNVLNTHGANSLSIREVAFEQIPFEFGPIPGIIFIVGAGGINYFRRKRK